MSWTENENLLNKPLVIAVEGNIGSGKSTFLSYCKSESYIELYPEPVDKYRNVKGENLLAKFYENPIKWAMTLQMYVNMTILDNYRATTPKMIKLIERSLLSSRYCFLENLRSNGVLEPVMASVLDEWYDKIEEDDRSIPHAIVYIWSTPEVAHNRMLKRAREEEVQVSLEYLQQLHNLYELWLNGEQVRNRMEILDIPVFVIDSERPLEEMCSQYEDCLKDIRLLALK